MGDGGEDTGRASPALNELGWHSGPGMSDAVGCPVTVPSSSLGAFVCAAEGLPSKAVSLGGCQHSCSPCSGNSFFSSDRSVFRRDPGSRSGSFFQRHSLSGSLKTAVLVPPAALGGEIT